MWNSLGWRPVISLRGVCAPSAALALTHADEMTRVRTAGGLLSDRQPPLLLGAARGGRRRAAPAEQPPRCDTGPAEGALLLI